MLTDVFFYVTRDTAEDKHVNDSRNTLIQLRREKKKNRDIFLHYIGQMYYVDIKEGKLCDG